MAEVSIVIPVYHNEKNIPDLTAALARCAPGPEFEFVFVDDGSQDGSWRLLEEYAAHEPRARLVKLSRNFGAFTACVAGLAHATGRAAGLMSAGLQGPPGVDAPQEGQVFHRLPGLVLLLPHSRGAGARGAVRARRLRARRCHSGAPAAREHPGTGLERADGRRARAGRPAVPDARRDRGIPLADAR